jgi:hypothetical protein
MINISSSYMEAMGLVGTIEDVTKHDAVPDDDTDNKSAINEAISAIYDAGGGILLFPPSELAFQTSGDHMLPNNITIRAYGATIKKKEPTPTHLFRADGTEKLRVDGGTYDLNRSNDLNRSGFSDGSLVQAFYLVRHNRARFFNISVKNCSEVAVKCWNSCDVIITGSQFDNSFGNFIEINNPEVDNSKSNMPAPRSENYLIMHNCFRDVYDKSQGTHVESAAVQVNTNKDTKRQNHNNICIYNNMFSGCVRAIWLEACGMNHQIENAHIIGNTIVGGAAPFETFYGIGLVEVWNGTVINNIIQNVVSAPIGDNDRTGIVISGNAVENGGGSQDIVIAGNIVRDLREPPNNYTKHCIILKRGNRLSVIHNLLSGSNEELIWIAENTEDIKISNLTII